MKIQAQNIVYRVGAATILNGVGFDVRPGEVLGLIGPNGVGKTTLLRILANLLEPATGVVTYDGARAVDIAPVELAKKLSYLAQGSIVHWPLRTEAVVALGRLPHRRGFSDLSANDHAVVATAIEMCDVAHLIGRSFDTLSGGEQRRVLLARALAVGADILLADEPGAALDLYHQLQVMELLAQAAAAGTGVVVVLHDLGLAARFCHRVVLLDKGRVVADGSPAEVLNDGNIAAVYRVAVHRGGADNPFIIPDRRL